MTVILPKVIRVGACGVDRQTETYAGVAILRDRMAVSP
jgi:hypothetical protein